MSGEILPRRMLIPSFFNVMEFSMKVLTLVALCFLGGICYRVSLGSEEVPTGSDLVEIGCVPQEPSRACIVAVNTFVSGLGYSYRYYEILFNKYGTYAGVDKATWDRLRMYDLCIGKSNGEIPAQAVSNYIASRPETLTQTSVSVLIAVLKEYWSCEVD